MHFFGRQSLLAFFFPSLVPLLYSPYFWSVSWDPCVSHKLPTLIRSPQRSHLQPIIHLGGALNVPLSQANGSIYPFLDTRFIFNSTFRILPPKDTQLFSHVVWFSCFIFVSRLFLLPSPAFCRPMDSRGLKFISTLVIC